MEGLGLAKSYQRGAEAVVALGGVDLVLEPGEVVVVRGPSGSGKTTLLNLLCGWEHPDRGAVTWQGEPTDPAALGWHELAIVPQAIGLLDELTVGENVELPARLSPTVAAATEEGSLRDLLDRLGIGHLARRLPGEASLGEQQRASVARALAAVPAVVLADEPTAHQDGGWGGEVLAALRALAQRGSGCIVASHDPAALAQADRVVTLYDGRVT